MQVSRGNILKTIGMLCNPNFAYKNNQYFNLSPITFAYIFPLPTHIFTINSKTGSYHFCQANKSFVLKPCVGPPLFSVVTIKRGCLLSYGWCVEREREEIELMRQA